MALTDVEIVATQKDKQRGITPMLSFNDRIENGAFR